MVRVFNVATTTITQEYQQHRAAVQQLAFTADGGRLLSAGGDGNLCVYEVAQVGAQARARGGTGGEVLPV
jgi:WD40 repeat protein